MKIQKKYILFFTVLTMAGLVSCRKYLDKKSDTSLVVPTTIMDLQALLDNNNLTNAEMTPSTGDASSDDYFLLAVTYNSLVDEEKKDYRWEPYDRYVQNDWSVSYNVVGVVNLCLEQIEKIPVNASNRAEWNNVKGSSLFLRAYSFLNLAWIYAKAYDETSSNTDLGIDLRVGTDFNVPSVRATVKETYERVLKDAKEAIPLLPDLPQHVFRPSKAAVYGLLARAYLSMRIYDSAFKYSDKCLQLQSGLLNYNDGTKVSQAASNTNPFSLSPREKNPEIIFYSELDLTNSVIATSRAKIDTNLYLSYSTNDWRRTIFFRAVAPYQRFKGNYTANINKYFSGIATDEMYLTRAECYARAGNKDAAMADLNTLLVKRWKTAAWVPLTATDAPDALAKIKVERRKELLFRGLRWMDIKRFNKENANIVLTRILPGAIVVTLQPNANYYAHPLPKDIIDLTGMPQNPYP